MLLCSLLDTDIIATHYSPQARRRSSALANRSGSLDSVYDPSSGGKGESAASPHKSNRVAAWAANFQTLLDDPYGVGLFQVSCVMSNIVTSCLTVHSIPLAVMSESWTILVTE